MLTSRQNPLVQQARAVRAGKDASMLLVEGLRLCTEAARARLPVTQALYTNRFAAAERGAQLLRKLQHAGAQLVEVSEHVLAAVADTKSPQGIVVLARRPQLGPVEFERAQPAAPLLVVLCRINNPANAGALLRVAEAAGATGVISLAGTTDLYAPKALRGAMGSTFRLPLWGHAEFAAVTAWCAARGISTVATALTATETHTSLDWRPARAVFVGPEAGGLLAAETAAADTSIRIPMRAPVESLNVATALAVVLYEAARQRGLTERHH